MGNCISLIKTFFNKKTDKVIFILLSTVITIVIALIVAQLSFNNYSKGTVDEYSKSFEAENMTIKGDVKIIEDQAVSGAKYIQF